jgi:hypothetical protein
MTSASIQPLFSASQAWHTDSTSSSSNVARRLGIVSNVAIMLALATTVGVSSNTDQLVTAEVRRYADATIGGTVFFVSRAASVSSAASVHSTAASVRNLYDSSGLTWDQLARLFGVSRRAVHAWSSGSKMTGFHVDALARINALVNDLPVSTAEDRRTYLLAPRPNGRSLFDSFRSRNPKPPLSNGSPLRPDQLLGSLREE